MLTSVRSHQRARSSLATHRRLHAQHHRTRPASSDQRLGISTKCTVAGEHAACRESCTTSSPRICGQRRDRSRARRLCPSSRTRPRSRGRSAGGSSSAHATDCATRPRFPMTRPSHLARSNVDQRATVRRPVLRPGAPGTPAPPCRRPPVRVRIRLLPRLVVEIVVESSPGTRTFSGASPSPRPSTPRSGADTVSLGRARSQPPDGCCSHPH